MAVKFIYKIKIKGLKEPLTITDPQKGQLFKQRFDVLTPGEKEKKCAIGEEWSGTWGEVASVLRIQEQVADETPKRKNDDGKPTMTFWQFAEKHPDKVKIWETFLGKTWDKEQRKFV